MTVHKAKGLEFPSRDPGRHDGEAPARRASRYLDAERGVCAIRLAGCSPIDLLQHEADELQRDEAEGVRIAYVAATRARDLLVVPAVGDEERRRLDRAAEPGDLSADRRAATAGRRRPDASSSNRRIPSCSGPRGERRHEDGLSGAACLSSGRHEFPSSGGIRARSNSTRQRPSVSAAQSSSSRTSPRQSSVRFCRVTTPGARGVDAPSPQAVRAFGDSANR